MLKKLRLTLISAAVVSLTNGALYAQDAKQPAPSEDPAASPTTEATMGPVAADTDRANQSTRPNDQNTGSANQGAQDQAGAGASNSTRPTDDSTGSTEHKRAQKPKHNSQDGGTQKGSHPGNAQSPNSQDGGRQKGSSPGNAQDQQR